MDKKLGLHEPMALLGRRDSEFFTDTASGKVVPPLDHKKPSENVGCSVVHGIY